ncbi:hypothetical protein DPV79_40220 [Burkholderia reimsis]|uniref:DUF4265 domain-containing protein n=1 Tax=Burkholderia reimsis TaxID=2234132 RepID=A0A365QGI3_9BURK|nr:DUF4265 domain-containing protein [Burkholderia reimsis]RBB31837.1 hypothetical protein DPV79_40220 [Burkholderia reimsis]
MDAEKERCLVNVYAGHNDAGPVYEELPALSIGDGSYELLSSPGLALNLAKGDLIRIADTDRPATVLRRGGNFCVQIYADEIPRGEVERLEREVGQELAGSLDGVNGGNLALSVPSTNGIEAINRFFDEFKERTGIEWYYANVYKNFEDPSDETLLDWWLKR